MIRRNILLGSVAILFALLLIVPTGRLAGIEADSTARITPGLVAQLSAAGPDEIVTAIVKLRAAPKLDQIRGKRAAVLSELHRNSKASQKAVINFLNLPDVKNKVKKIRRFWIDNLVLVKATKDVITRIAERPDVQEVFENFTITLPPMPESSKMQGPRGSPEQTQSQLWDSIDKIGAKQVWSTYGLDGAGVRVGGLDTGVDISHPDIAGKMITTDPGDPTYPGGWAEFDVDGNIVPGSVPHDTHAHGTHTTGTMIGGNASGYDIGVAPGASLIHGLVIPGGGGTFAQVVGGMEWIIDPDGNPATDDGAQVVNMSLGAFGTYPQMIAPTDNMVAADVFPSFSIGNSGPGPGTTGSPGNVPSAFGVGATDSSDVIAYFSSRGPVTWNDPPYVGTWTKPDISAPGVQIYSSVPGGDWQWHGVGWDWSGTSMAAPHVSGTVALMRQANPSLTVDEVKQLLAQAAIDYGYPGMDNDYGWGRVDAFAAVNAAVVGVGTLEGTIFSYAGGVVDNAEILIVDNGQKTYSDEFGHYSLRVVAGDHTVRVSRFGYDSSSASATIVADMVTTLDVTLNQLPSGTVAGSVTDEETGAGIAANITVEYEGEAVVSASTDSSTGQYSILLPVGTYDLVFNPGFPYPLTSRHDIDVFENTTTVLDLSLSRAQILIVDDDNGRSYETYYEQAVSSTGRSYLTVTTPVLASDMAQFESVVWFTGDDYITTLTARERNEIEAYLEGGGRFFLSGQDIGYDIYYTDFYSYYLRAVYVQDDVNLGGVIGFPASPVGHGFSFNIKGGDGANNQVFPSEIDPIYPAQTAFIYDPSVPASAMSSNGVIKDEVESDGTISSGTAGLTLEVGAYKLVYFSFGFEAIATPTDRTLVIDRVLDWLMGYPEITHTPLGETEDTENPYRVSAFITSDYFALDPSSFAVVYETGGDETSVAMTPTGVANEFEGYIPAQEIDTQVNYYITASDIEGHTSTDPVGAPLNKHSFLVARDEQAPIVEHRRLYDTNDLIGPYRIFASVTDNLGVEALYIIYARNGGAFHRLRMELLEDGQYYGEIPGPSQAGDFYDYYIYAMDEAYSGNVTRVPEAGAYRFQIIEQFVWDFEEYDGGFTETGVVWEWGEPSSGPAGAHSGVKLWATKLGSNYPIAADARLDVPEIAITPNKPYAIFSFWHWYDIETTYDGGNVKISTDGGLTWEVVTPFGGYDGTAGLGNPAIPGEPCFTGHQSNIWQQAIFDLSAYAGQQVIIRFHFGSDGSINRPGWYVDDVTLRSTDYDDIAPVITGTEVPPSTFSTQGPYEVTTYVRDFISGVRSVSILYSVDDGESFTEIPMSPGTGEDEWVGQIPGQEAGTKIRFFIKATDTASLPNETTDPPGAPAETYEFAILPYAPTLVMIGSNYGASLEMFREAMEVYGHEADYWNRATQGWLPLYYLLHYRTIVLDERGDLTTIQRIHLAAFLQSGSPNNRKQIFLLGRDLAWSYSTRSWIEEYMRAAYVQDDPGFREISGEPGEEIGAGEIFTISGSYPDEVQRSSTYPGGKIVYRFTGQGTTLEREEVEGTYEKVLKEWDGVMPNAPNSQDAAAGIKYGSEQYRSVYFTFNFDYIQEPERRAGIIHRVLGWFSEPEIMHVPLQDTEDTLQAYQVVAQVFSETLDSSSIELTYDVGAGPVSVLMTPTGNPDEYSADIPPQLHGTTVRYYLSAANLDGSTSYHPPGAPDEQHTFSVREDVIPPDIVHTPYPSTANLTGPYEIVATVTDNIAVDTSGVLVVYNKNGGTDQTVPMVSLGGDLYQADIPGPSVFGDVYNYYISAMDMAAVPNTARDPDVGYHSFEITDYYTWDFEENDGSFTPTGPDWEWGEPISGPGDAHSGTKLWATNLEGNYSTSSNSKLDLPTISVPNTHTYAQLSFWQWYYIETYYDGANVKISTNGGNSWTILVPDIGYNGVASIGNAGIPNELCFTGYNNDSWHQVTFDLTLYKGLDVIIRLHFGSDSSVERVGWYVDDLEVKGTEDAAGPVLVSTRIPNSTFDTAGPYNVAATVLDDLSGVATVKLHYSTNNGESWTPVAMGATGNPDEYSGDIPGQPSGTRIKLYLEATDSASNSTTFPEDATGSSYEFGIMPSADYLVILGGYSHTDQIMFQEAFSAIGRSSDIWDWDDQGLPTLEDLLHYQAVIVDESEYFDSSQQDLLGSFLDTADGVRKQIFMLGRDLSYDYSVRSWMEQYTGSYYAKDGPGWRELTSTPGDPVGTDEIFVIQGPFPDQLMLSETYPGGVIVYRYSGQGSTLDLFDTETELREFYEKNGKDWDPKFWPMVPSGPDSAAAVRYVGTNFSSVYFTFNFDYIREEQRRASVLDRVLAWLSGAAGSFGTSSVASEDEEPEIPDKLSLSQNFPNPFNPVTRVRIGVPRGEQGPVSVKIYNVHGQIVKTLFEGTRQPGIYTFEWDGKNDRGSSVSSGIYFCRLDASGTSISRKMVLLR